jgi:hypothetical protein
MGLGLHVIVVVCDPNVSEYSRSNIIKREC